MKAQASLLIAGYGLRLPDWEKGKYIYTKEVRFNVPLSNELQSKIRYDICLNGEPFIDTDCFWENRDDWILYSIEKQMDIEPIQEQDWSGCFLSPDYYLINKCHFTRIYDEKSEQKPILISNV